MPKNKVISADSVISLFQKSKKALLLREIYHLLGIPKEKREEVRKIIKDLVKEGRLVQIRKRRFALPERVSVLKGRLRVHPDGFGFVETEDNKTVFIPPRRLGKAFDGDIVLVRIERTTRKGPEGSIISVLERQRTHIVGYLVKKNKFYFVEPEDRRLPFIIFIPKKRRNKAKEGHLVISKIIEPRSEFGVPVGEIIKDLGDPNELAPHCYATIINYNLPQDFSEQVQKELNKLPDDVSEKDFKGRVDLRRLLFVTIDGETARDFDDAIYVKKTKQGYKLWVAIADVSHYVKKKTPLDEEAYLRGTSVYFPIMVIPMFPPKLSNHLCSLNPLVD
ncbi:MAG: RNB domain-containing ribonuclease, partial [Caldimicrobium sp.]